MRATDLYDEVDTMQRVKILAFLPLLAFLGACNTDPHARAVRYVENGNKFYDREKYKEASIMYRRAVAANADPRYGEAWYRLGLTFLKLGAAGEFEVFRAIQIADIVDGDDEGEVAEEGGRVLDVEEVGFVGA